MMEWFFQKANTAFASHKNEWDSLNRASGNHILLDSRFVEPLIKHFESDDVTLAVCKDSGGCRAMALLVKDRLGVWSTFQPSQAPLGLILIGQDVQPYEIAMDLVEAIPGFTALLGVMQQDPRFSRFANLDPAANVELLDYIDTARLELHGSFTEYWEKRGKNLKHNLDRQTRRLREAGRSLELIAVRHREGLAECMREYGRLESSGWKAGGGTAIEENNTQGRFYREIFEDFFSTGEAVIFQLRIDGKVAASDLCLARDGMLVVLKTAYDETVEKCSPALLMRREITKHLFNEGVIHTIEFYGKVRDWHLQWTTDVRRMFHVNIFRSVHLVRTRKLLKALR
jgi:CelD/BcsL family acetyltransferase involved in cellulose biosynthesis